MGIICKYKHHTRKNKMLKKLLLIASIEFGVLIAIILAPLQIALKELGKNQIRKS